MKKTILLTIVAMMTMLSVNAQEYEKKHEVAVSLGALSTSNYLDIYEDMITSVIGVSYDDDNYTGPISAEYFYHVKNWLGVGGIFAYGNMHQDFYLGSKKDGRDGELKNSYFTLMPAVKFDWLRKKNFGMYSKLGLGATLRTEKMEYDRNGHDDYDESEVHFNWQVSLLGIEAGSPTLRGFLELGMGEQGTALIGVRYKF